MKRSLLLLFKITLLCLLITHCSSEDSDSDSTTPVEANFNSLWDNGFKNCGSCHDGQSDESIAELDPNIYDLSTKASFENLKNLSHDQAAAGCTYLGEVPLDSVIAQSVIDFGNVGACNSESYNFQFEKGASPSASGFADALKQWLEAGAQF